MLAMNTLLGPLFCKIWHQIHPGPSVLSSEQQGQVPSNFMSQTLIVWLETLEGD